MLALIAAASAGNVELVSGQPQDQDFQDCLASPNCEENFKSFLGQSMSEQGFTMQHHAIADSALSNPGEGLVVGAALSTFPFGPPVENLSGKEENTSFSPVFPRLQVAWFGQRWSVGAFGLPPIPVSGASAWTAGLSGSVTRPLGDWTGGLEADFSYLVANAPVTASQEQIDDRDSLSNPDNLDPDVADASCGGDGCIDRFTLANFALRAGVSRELGRLTPYGKLGVTRVNERLAVEYDSTEWLLRVTQPSPISAAGSHSVSAGSWARAPLWR
ncbi:MAG TPA: hypothetical protein QGF58_12930 [Myxococcota bacterium]|nr:hypothetical protein [Myxococcota bacterium]